MENEVLTIEGLQELFNKQKTDVDGLVTAKLSDWSDKFKASYKVDNGPEKPAEVKTAAEVAELSDAGILGGINKIEIMKIPLGKIVVGGFVSVFATELIDGFMSKQSAMVRGLVKLVIAAMAVKYGKKYLGEASTAIALLMGFDAIRDIIPIDTYAKNIATKLSGTWTNKGLAQGGPMRAFPVGGSSRHDYYSAAERR